MPKATRARRRVVDGVWCGEGVPSPGNATFFQGCSLGLERLGLETVSRRFFGTSRSCLGLEG